MFCMIPRERIISVNDVKDIYQVPGLLEKQNVDSLIMEYFGMNRNKIKTNIFNLLSFRNFERIKIAIVGKYSKFIDSYLSLRKALFHSSYQKKIKLDIEWIDPDNNVNMEGIHGILIPGGFGPRGAEGKILMCKYARENNIPFLGICFGFQLGIIEYCRNVLGWKNANTEEITGSKDSLIHSRDGNMRKGLFPILVKDNTLLFSLYGNNRVEERHRHRYEVNCCYKKRIENSDFVWAGETEDGILEAFELRDHIYHIGVQYHPEFLSRFEKPSEIFSGFLKGCMEYKLSYGIV